MKIEIVGRKDMVNSVEVGLDVATGQLYLLINTRNRWVPHQLSGGWGLYEASLSLPEDAPLPSYRLIAIGEIRVGEFSPGAEVAIVPETKEEEELLFGVAYHHSKDEQICYMFVPNRLDTLRNLKTLARLTV